MESKEILTCLPAEDLDDGDAALVELVDDAAPKQSFLRRAALGIASCIEWLFGTAALIVGLSLLAATPLLQFLSLGYLLESGGRVARSGRLRDGFIGARRAARVGGIVLGAWLVLWPLRIVSSLAESAEWVDPGGAAARRWQTGFWVLLAVTLVHVFAACARGGKLRYFFWPFNPIWLARKVRAGGYYGSARDAVWDFVIGLRLPYYFWLGIRGFAGTLAWLVVPVSLLVVGRKIPALGFLGAVLLGIVMLYVPFLQMRFAATNGFRSFFELRATRALFRQAPWAFALSFLLTLAFATPLYLLKIEMVPREVVGLEALVFIVFIFPARLATGWAYGWAGRRPAPRNWFMRWTARLGMVATAAAYVVIVFFSQYFAWKGVWSLYEQHAFLLPVPFLGS